VGNPLIVNHLDQSLRWANQKETLSSSQVKFITLFCAGSHRCCCCAFFHQPPQTVELCWAKTIFFIKSSIFLTFLYPISLVQDHRFSTTGDALSLPSSMHFFFGKMKCFFSQESMCPLCWTTWLSYLSKKACEQIKQQQKNTCTFWSLPTLTLSSDSVL
jgi:hypothetical protein